MNVIKPKLKVLYIVGRSSYDGTCIFAYRLAKELTEYDSTFLFVQKGSADGEFKNLKKIYLSDSKEKKNFITYIISVFLFFAKNKFNVIHYQSGGRVVLFLSFLLKKNARYVHHFHCGNLTCKPTKTKPGLLDILLFRFFKNKSYQIAVSKKVVNQYEKYVGVSKTLIQNSNTVPFEFKKKQMLNYAIGYIGQISKSKNFDSFQNCIISISEKYPEIQYIVKGDNYYNSNTDNKIKYIPPSLDVESFYESIDLILFPSDAPYEGLPLIVLEAIAKDTPVIAVKNPMINEILCDYPLCVNQFKPEAVTEKISWFYDNENNRIELHRRHNLIHQKYNFEKMISKISELYS